LQNFLHFTLGVMNAGFDRSFGAADDLGDLGEGEILEKVQHKNFAV
jgi:hypothetical protein